MRRDRRLRDAHLVDVDDAVPSLFQILYLSICCGCLFLHFNLFILVHDLRFSDLLLADTCVPVYLAEVVDGELGVGIPDLECAASFSQR